MVGFGSFESDEKLAFYACAEEIVRKVAGEEGSLLAIPVAKNVATIAKAKTATEQNKGLDSIKEFLTGYMNPDSIITINQPDMQKTREILARHNFLKPLP